MAETSLPGVIDFSIIGKPLARIDAVPKVTGHARYLPDLKIQGMLYGKILRSPFAHAVIRRLDVQPALKVPGVRAVITAQDIPHHKFSFFPTLADKLMLCEERVRFVGDEVAALAADTPEIAERAIHLIEVEYDPRPGVFDPEEAARPGTVLVHEERGSNITYETHRTFGDIEKGFAESDHVFEEKFQTPRIAHCCLETRGCIALYQRGGEITLWAPIQTPHIIRQEMARILGVQKSRIRVISTPVGGAFGSKSVMDMAMPIAAILSRLTGRPVRIINSREEEFITGRVRYPYVIHLKTGVMRDGRILAKQAKVYVDNGAYNDRGPSTLNWAGLTFSALYNVPNGSYDGYGVYTNNEPGTAFRGFGGPQLTFAFESHLDRIARHLDLDPREIRLRNSLCSGQTTHSGFFINSCGLSECIEEAVRRSDWLEKRQAYDRQDKMASRRRGIGMACMAHTGAGTRYYGYQATDTFIKVSEDGVITVITPTAEIGQGTTTAISQIVAEKLGADLQDIRIVNDDTELTAYDLGAIGSRETFICGNSALAAAEETKRELLEVAGCMLDTQPQMLTAAGGRVFPRGEPQGRSVTIREVAEYAVFKMGRPISGRGRYADALAPTASLSTSHTIHVPTWTFACQIAEVEVDQETGQVEVLKMTAIHDTGKVINPLLVEGQVEGSLAQGLGNALIEELVTKQGVSQNPSFTDYKILHAEDMPEMDVGFVDVFDSLGPYGAKGIGESGIVATLAAVGNAVYHATGLELNELPLNPERILKALEETRLQAPGQKGPASKTKGGEEGD
jgi:CO/xanthine dehydrogenase Mo-binding subunit